MYARCTLIVVGKTFEEHLTNLKEVFTHLRQAGLRLKPKKCLFGSLPWVRGLDLPRPTEGRGSEVFFIPTRYKDPQGLASCRRFVPGFSVIASPLFALTKKDVAFEWSAECEKAFQKLKDTLTEALLDRGFVLETDASGLGLGAVLPQKQEPPDP